MSKLDRAAARPETTDMYLEMLRAREEHIASQDALIASQAAEIERLKRSLKDFTLVVMEASVQIGHLKSEIENAPHGPQCNYKWHPIHPMGGYSQEGEMPCNCWKRAALAQVSASPKEEQPHE